MRKKAHILLICVFVLALCLCCVFFACKRQSSISVSLQGSAYRGAIVGVSAMVTGMDESEKAQFEILEDYDWVYFGNGKLVFSHNAVFGATVTVRVTMGGKSADSSLIVGHTPITEIKLIAPSSMVAGESYALSYSVTPSYADDVPVSFSLLSGKNVATLNGNMLAVADTADKSDLLCVGVTAGGMSAEGEIAISTVQPTALQIEASALALKRGESATLSCTVSPLDCTLGAAELWLEQSDAYSYSNGVLTISNTAPEGEITVSARLGKVESSIVINIVKTDVASLNFISDALSAVKYGQRVEFSTEVLPSNATYPEVAISLVEGGDYISYNEEDNAFTVTSREIDKSIVFAARAGDITRVLSFVTSKTAVENVVISTDGDKAVSVGDRRAISALVIPAEATFPNITFSVTKGAEHVTFENNVLWFDSIGEGKTEVTVTATADGVSESLTFYISPIPVQSIVISALSPVTELRGGDEVVFEAAVYPDYATYGSVTFVADKSGLGSFANNVFTVASRVGVNSVQVYAVSADGVESNRIELQIVGELTTISPSAWSSVDNREGLFDDINSLKLVLGALPDNSDCATVIISDDVSYMEIWGDYDGENGYFQNLSFYFLTSDVITVKLYNFAVVNAKGFTGAVFDFGNDARVMLELCGVNSITAGSAYCASTVGYAVNGEFTGTDDYIRKNGMDGFNGRNGGTCINADYLEITGLGTISLYAGSGASGTDGTDGANSQTQIAAGKGGNGGYGGDSGYAVFANELILNSTGMLYAYGGNGGTGGLGGKGGICSDPQLSGADGSKGADGKANDPLYAVTSLLNVSQKVRSTEGSVKTNTEVRVIEVASFSKLLEKYYKITIVYGTAVENPYHAYNMSDQTSNYELCRMLYALDYALSVFPKSLYLELASINSPLKINFVDKIKKNLSVIYGLTNSSNQVWLATFDTKLRDTFYSTHYNIFIHELFHTLTFSMGELSDNPMDNVLRGINGCSYTTSSSYVYDPQNGYNANNSAFLTAYSKSNFNEDISDNLSLIAMLAQKPDFMEKGTKIYQKVSYISTVYEGFYRTLWAYTESPWKKFLD